MAVRSAAFWLSVTRCSGVCYTHTRSHTPAKGTGMATTSTVRTLLDAADFLHRISVLLPEGEREAALSEAERATAVAQRLMEGGDQHHGNQASRWGDEGPGETSHQGRSTE